MIRGERASCSQTDFMHGRWFWRRVHPGLFLLACVCASPRRLAAEGGILRVRGLVGGRCMHLHLYRDESRSGHFDLVGEGDHPWTVDLVTVTAAAILVVGFASALVAHLVR